MSSVTQSNKPWKLMPIRELAETCSGSTPSRGRKDYFGGEIPWVKTGELIDGIITQTEESITQLALKETNLRILPRGTLLIAMYGQGQTRGRTGLLDCEATTNQACFAILPNESFIPAFLQYWFRYSYDRLRRNSQGRGGNQSNFNGNVLRSELVPVPDKIQQAKISDTLQVQLSEVERAIASIEVQIKTCETLGDVLLRESLTKSDQRPAGDCLVEVTSGIGESWNNYPVLGATRSGIAPAKEPVGKNPYRYKLVRPGTIFYNPMRILLGSIAMIDDGDISGITSPDYVVMNAIEGQLHPCWFYYWFRSPYGAEFIKSLSRGAVRERLLFKRLACATIPVPNWNAQIKFAAQINGINTFKKALKNKLFSIETLPSQILHQTFCGII